MGTNIYSSQVKNKILSLALILTVIEWRQGRGYLTTFEEVITILAVS